MMLDSNKGTNVGPLEKQENSQHNLALAQRIDKPPADFKLAGW